MGQKQSICVFDAETTGLDVAADQIIELCVQQGLSADSPRRTWRIKPTVDISPEAQKVHGISAADLAECPQFGELADEIREIFSKADVIFGYNVGFDLNMLDAEFRRIGKPLNLSHALVIDALRLWQRCEPRSLSDAYKRFVGQELDGAHAAEQDVIATGEVIEGMLDSFGVKKKSWQELADLIEPKRSTWLGPSHHFSWDGDTPVFGFGKHSGRPIVEVAAEQKGGYLRWVLEKDFPEHVREIAQAALDDVDNFETWARKQYRG